MDLLPDETQMKGVSRIATAQKGVAKS